MIIRLTALLATFAFWISPLIGQGERPNILFAFADDWGRYASCYAQTEGADSINSVFKTPNIDRVAKEGVIFKHAFVNAPSCTPCRSSLLSGQYFWRTGRGAILQGAVWDLAIPSFPLLLKDAGYQIGQTYKVWTPGTPRDAPFGSNEFAFEKRGQRFNGFSQFVTKQVSQGKSPDAAKELLYEEARGNLGDFLSSRKEAAKPFCYWWGPTNVHRKWIKGSGKDLWGIDPEDLKGKLPPFLPDVPEIREDFADYLGEVAAFDAGLGVLLKQLKEAGELENTLIVISGDHGPPGFSHGKCDLYDFGTNVPLIVSWPSKFKGGRILDDLVSLTDLAPTLLEAAGESPPEVMTGRSLIPVLTSDKSGLVDPKRDHVLTGRERHVAKVRAGELGYPMRAIRTKDHLYIRNFKPDRWPMGEPREITDDSAPSRQKLTNNTFITLGDYDASPTKAWIVENRNDPEHKRFYDYAFGKRPAEELYILAEDPHQMKNVAEDSKYAEIKKQLSDRLMAELKATGDPRVTGEKNTYDKPPFALGE